MPIASLPLENGNVVEFYNFGRRVLVSEAGSAKNPPRFRPKGRLRIDQLQSVWKELASTRPVPAALRELQERLTSTAPTTLPEQVDRVPETLLGGELAQPAAAPVQTHLQAEGVAASRLALTGCNNGCCDYAWLSTFQECGGGWDYSWFNFNYTWSTANSTSIDMYQGFVCSAVGTSTYKVDILGEGLGGTWSIPEAHYRTWHWFDDFCSITVFCSDEDMNSSVNSSSNPHLHTYCGKVSY